MAISQAITVSFKQDLMSPGGNLEALTLKCALYDNTATLNQNTTAYITANEISASGTNYTTGGATLSNVKNGASYEDLSNIINLFDLYVQYANCEGFGLPQVEAAACGIPVVSTDYSAMESVIRKLEGFPVKPKDLYKELETGCLRAVQDNALAADIF